MEGCGAVLLAVTFEKQMCKFWSLGRTLEWVVPRCVGATLHGTAGAHGFSPRGAWGPLRRAARDHNRAAGGMQAPCAHAAPQRGPVQRFLPLHCCDVCIGSPYQSQRRWSVEDSADFKTMLSQVLCRVLPRTPPFPRHPFPATQPPVLTPPPLLSHVHLRTGQHALPGHDCPHPLRPLVRVPLLDAVRGVAGHAVCDAQRPQVGGWHEKCALPHRTPDLPHLSARPPPRAPLVCSHR